MFRPTANNISFIGGKKTGNFHVTQLQVFVITFREANINKKIHLLCMPIHVSNINGSTT